MIYETQSALKSSRTNMASAAWQQTKSNLRCFFFFCSFKKTAQPHTASAQSFLINLVYFSVILGGELIKKKVLVKIKKSASIPLSICQKCLEELTYWLASR